MIIKLIPETEEEKIRFRENFSSDEIVHEGINEFFLFGNKIVNNFQLTDFHEWTGSPRYLMGNLRYFYEVVNDERRMKEIGNRNQKNNQPTKVNKMNFPKIEEIKDLEVEAIDDEQVENAKVMTENRFPKIVKKGDIAPNIQTIDVENLKKKDVVSEPKVIKISDLKNKGYSDTNEEPMPSIPKVDFPNHFQK